MLSHRRWARLVSFGFWFKYLGKVLRHLSSRPKWIQSLENHFSLIEAVNDIWATRVWGNSEINPESGVGLMCIHMTHLPLINYTYHTHTQVKSSQVKAKSNMTVFYPWGQDWGLWERERAPNVLTDTFAVLKILTSTQVTTFFFSLLKGSSFLSSLWWIISHLSSSNWLSYSFFYMLVPTGRRGQ